MRSPTAAGTREEAHAAASAGRYGVLREVLAERSGDTEWEKRLAAELTAAALGSMPEIEPDEDLRRLAGEASAGVVEMVIAMIAAGSDPAAATPPGPTFELARELALRGEPVDRLIRAYHVAHARFFELWARDVRESVPDPARMSAAIEEGAAWTFEFVDALGRVIAERFAEQRERWVRSATALRLQEVRAILAGRQSDAPMASARLGYELSLRHRALVLWTEQAEEAEGESDLAGQARAILAALGARGGLVVPLADGLLAAWAPAPAREEPEVLRDALALARSPVSVGSPHSGLEGFRLSHEEALRARRIARLSGAGGATVYRDVALLDLATADLERARRFVAAELGLLAGGDPGVARLARTLRAYLEHRGSARRAAEELGVHENTVANRVHAACELLGHGVEERMPEVLLALRLNEVPGLLDPRLGPDH